MNEWFDDDMVMVSDLDGPLSQGPNGPYIAHGTEVRARGRKVAPERVCGVPYQTTPISPFGILYELDDASGFVRFSRVVAL